MTRPELYLEELAARRYEQSIMVRTVVHVLTLQRAGCTTWEIDWCLELGQPRIRSLLADLEADGDVRRHGRRSHGYLWRAVGVSW